MDTRHARRRRWMPAVAAVFTLAALVAFGAAAYALGVPGQWTALPGPGGGLVTDIETSPGFVNDNLVLVAVNPGGVFRSIDGGLSYARSSRGLTDRRVNAVAISKHLPDDGLVFAATDGGLFRSSDSGVSWTQVTAGLPAAAINGVEISLHVAESNRIYAAVEGHGVFVSFDRGVNWQNAGSAGLTDLNLQGLHISRGPAGTDELVVWTEQTVLRSIGPTTSWVNIGADASLPSFYVPLSAALSPRFANDDTLFIGTSARGIWFSTNRGASSTRSTQSAADVGAVHSVAVSTNFPTDSTVWAASSTAGALRSTDGGVSFASNTSGLRETDIRQIGLSPDMLVNPVILAGRASGGVSRSPDRGMTWWNAVHGLAGSRIADIGFSSAFGSDQIVLAGGTNAVQRSLDGGLLFEELSAAPPSRNVTAFAASPATASDASSLVAIGTQGLYRTFTNGLWWVEANTGLSDVLRANVRVIAYAPDYATSFNLLVGGAGGVARSVNGGHTWTDVSAGFGLADLQVTALVYDSASVVYASTTAGGVYRSNDGGSTWTALNAGLGTTLVWDVAGSGATVLAATPLGIYRSTDGAAT